MRIDAHHHLWTLVRGDCGWLTAKLQPIYRGLTLDDQAPLLASGGTAARIYLSIRGRQTC